MPFVRRSTKGTKTIHRDRSYKFHARKNRKNVMEFKQQSNREINSWKSFRPLLPLTSVPLFPSHLSCVISTVISWPVSVITLRIYDNKPRVLNALGYPILQIRERYTVVYSIPSAHIQLYNTTLKPFTVLPCIAVNSWDCVNRFGTGLEWPSVSYRSE